MTVELVVWCANGDDHYPAARAPTRQRQQGGAGMMMRCMTPGCPNIITTPDVLCPDCRRQSNNCVSVGFFPLDAYDAYHDDRPPDLSADLAQIAGHLVSDQHQRDGVIRHQQKRIALLRKIIRKAMQKRDTAESQASAEHARADGLEDQVTGLRVQVALLQLEIDQIHDLASTNGRQPGLATIDTAPGDYSPEYAGYNVLWTRVDPVTGREVLWRWYRAD